MKKACYIIAAVLTAAALLAACQATPDKPAVVQKDMEQMIEKAAETDAAKTLGVTLRERTGAPQRFEAEYTYGKLSVNVNADITVPDAAAIPVVRVAPADFTQETIDALWEYFVGDTEMVGAQAEKTKSEIEEDIVELRRKAESDPDYMGNDIAQKLIEQLEKRHAVAPETIVQAQCDGKLRDFERRDALTGTYSGQYTGIDAVSTVTGEGRITFRVKNHSEDEQIVADEETPYYLKDYSAWLDFERYDGIRQIPVKNGDDPVLPVGEAAGLGVKMTPEQARETVEQFFAQTGLPMSIHSMYISHTTDKDKTDYYKYILRCTRLVSGISCAYAGGDYMVKKKEKAGDMLYRAEWSPESFFFVVSDSGISSLCWGSPMDVRETVVEDSALQPFSEIQGIFENMMEVKYEYPENADLIEKATYDINDIWLELCRIAEQNSIDSGLLVPAWVFYGTTAEEYAGGEMQDAIDKTPRPLLVINAVDGSVIDTEKGY